MSTNSSPTVAHIEEASTRIAPFIVPTPLLYSPFLSELGGRPIYLKCENLQRTGSFKYRGALNKLRKAQEDGLHVTGVVAASSGNHGQAVAYAARELQLPCVVVVPENVIPEKEAAIHAYGAEVVRCGTTSNERIGLAAKIAKEQGYHLVPPYDDVDVMAGQGTLAAEILRDCPDASALFVPVGGGGLLAGVATWVKGVRPAVRVVGVEPATANDTHLSIKAGQIVSIGECTTVADGLRTTHPGELTFPINRGLVDEIRLVSEDEILGAVRHLLRRDKLVVEPSGAVGVAAALQDTKESSAAVCVLSGGNADMGLIGRLCG